MVDSKNNENKIARIAWYENNENFYEPIKFYLEKEGFDVKMVVSHEKAEEDIKEYKPHIVIFDYLMEHMSGLEFFESLKRIDLKFIPVFFTIWGKDDHTFAEIAAKGVDENLIFDKQITPASFAKSLLEYYRGKRPGKE